MPVTSIPIPRISLGKRKERSLMCEALTDDGRWIDRELPVLSSCADDDATGMAFLIDAENQYYCPEDNNWHQIITEKDQVPLCYRKQNVYQDGKNDEKELKGVSDDVFAMSFRRKQIEGIVKAKHNEAWNKLMWIVTVVCVTIAIVAAITHFG